jgi:ADP-heptose:LPS heptosyltransferase
MTLRRSIPESMLVILMGSLGDLVRGLCLADALKRGRPGCEITWLVEPQWLSLIQNHPHIDRLVVFDRPRGIVALPDLYRQLREAHFDITLDLQRHFKSGLFSRLSGAKRRIGFHRRNAKELNWLFNNEHIPWYSDRLNKLEHYLKFTTYLGIPCPDSLDFGLAHHAIERLNPPLATRLPHPFISVVMGSSWPSKDWTFLGYNELVRRILEEGKFGVVLIGDRSQANLADRLAKRFASPRILNLAGTTSLPEVTGILQAAAAGIGPDSGPGHLAAAVGTPYVSLFGPTTPERVAPYRCKDLVIQAPEPCFGCYRKRCRLKGITCMASITPDMVLPKLDQALRMGRLF